LEKPICATSPIELIPVSPAGLLVAHIRRGATASAERSIHLPEVSVGTWRWRLGE
jgi:hypothetical protein